MKYRFVAVYCFLLANIPAKTTQAQPVKPSPAAKQLEFKVIQYLQDGTIWRVSDKVIAAQKEPLDLYFYSRNFNCPYTLPLKFINSKFKNATDTAWSNPKAAKTSFQNKRYTYTYDSLARLVKFVYSGCMVCSDLPYTYHVNYDKDGRVSEIINANPLHPHFKIHYDAFGNVKQVDQLQEGKILRQIIRIK